MALETIHNVKKGISRLYTAPGDLGDFVKTQGIARPIAGATAKHQQLFEAYLRKFEAVCPVAAEWWTSLVDAQQEEGLPRDEAIEEAFDKRLAGPAAAPEFVTMVRETWLACAELNAQLAEAERVPPEVLLLGWLVDGGHDDFVVMLTCMPYWPMGLDEQGNWV